MKCRIQDYRHVDHVRILSSARIEINADAGVEQRDRSNDFAQVINLLLHITSNPCEILIIRDVSTSL